MAHHKSAKKRILRNEKRRLINKDRVSLIRTCVKRVKEAIEAGDYTLARTALKDAQPQLHRGVTKGIMHKNTVARTLSRLSASIKKLAA